MRAALHLFATKDFGRITLRDIQRASGFDAALIYYYFKNKQDLFDATVQFALEEAAGVHHLAKSSDADPAQVIRDWLQHSLNMAEYNGTILRIMMHYAGSNGEVDSKSRCRSSINAKRWTYSRTACGGALPASCFDRSIPWRSQAMFPCTLTGSLRPRWFAESLTWLLRSAISKRQSGCS